MQNEWRMMKDDWRMIEGWLKNDEGWKMKDEGWWFQAVEGFWFQMNKRTDICKIVLLERYKILLNFNILRIEGSFIHWVINCYRVLISALSGLWFILTSVILVIPAI